MGFLESKTFSSLKTQLLGSPKLIELVGTDSSVAIAKLFADARFKDSLDIPHLVIFPDATSAASFIDDLKFFDSKVSVHLLSGFDMSPYSGLYPSALDISKRVGWLDQASRATRHSIFVSTVDYLLQKTLPVSVLKERSLVLKAGTTLPDKFPRWLSENGYQATPHVEDYGHFSVRGGIVDIFSPSMEWPVRIELFGDEVESMRTFDPATQRSLDSVTLLKVLPAREVIFFEDFKARASQKLRSEFKSRKIPHHESESVLQDLLSGRYFHGIDYLLPYFYENPATPIDFFPSDFLVWKVNPIEITRKSDGLIKSLSDERLQSHSQLLLPEIDGIFSDKLNFEKSFKVVGVTSVSLKDPLNEALDAVHVDFPCFKISSFESEKEHSISLKFKSNFDSWNESKTKVVLATHTLNQAQRVFGLFEANSIPSVIVDTSKGDWAWEIDGIEDKIAIVPAPLSESLRFQEDSIVFLREEDFFGKKPRSAKKESEQFFDATSLSFAELTPGSKVVHVDHGVAIFDGLTTMNIQGVESEFLQLRFRDDDKLYLPVYRVSQLQKFSGSGILDKLGGSNWEKTKIKVKAHLKDIANDLLELYAKRKSMERNPFPPPDENYREFEAFFPFDETKDQLRAINDVLKDLQDTKPMDRLICGDVGFGKTEVALRAAFKVAQEGKQVAVLVPTTILAFQHFETFKKRFAKWPFVIKGFSRFTPTKESKEIISDLKNGKVDIVIGTHRLLSKDTVFKNLGLIIIDEEQRFGVAQKERLRQMRVLADTISMSATPIPRTLNMSLMGVRDLSLITTPPEERLPTRTFLCKYDIDTIRKAVLSEIQRGGQVFFVHNRVQSIYEKAEELKAAIPEARIIVGHGQMTENDLESAMLRFYNHEFDVLLSTTIIESGIDIPKANTMIVDRADTFGLSQLYQLRGRIGRSSARAYCYLMVPKSGVIDPMAQERLKTLQTYSDLGSGIHIAQYDLELRGAGNILGDEQSGHIEAVGYELYLELLEEAVQLARGEEKKTQLEPDINLPIKALIPDDYIADIRSRLAVYRRLSKISGVEDIDKIEDDLKDQYGNPPEPVYNLFGVMVIRFMCRNLGIRDISSGPKNLSLTFTNDPKIPAERLITLATTQPDKYKITPDNRLIIKMPTLKWTSIYEELVSL